MAALYDQYTRELHKEFGYFATWTLSQRRIAFDVKPPGKPAKFIYSSKGGVMRAARKKISTLTTSSGTFEPRCPSKIG